MYSKLIAALLLFVSTGCEAAVLPPVTSLTVGGQVILAPLATKAKTLIVKIESAANNRGNARTLNGTAGYQVPVAKSFRIKAFKCWGGAVQSGVNIGYSDNDLGFDSAGVFTNEVWIGGDGVPRFFTQAYAAFGNMQVELGSGFVVPTGKYVAMLGDASTQHVCTIFGEEE